ncbi:MAG: hypothetical protein IT168_04485 [Bryobacterales bacterium]|nr:hypothetical protein [Bryobacterales bacterium]
MTSRTARWAWCLPAIVSIVLFWPGIQCWFQQDDFAWLALGNGILTGKDLLRALFAPMAQGTIRPLSERVFFMGGFALFGLDALPFRVIVFLTFGLDLWLLYRVALRLFRSVAVAMAAVLLWGVNAALGIPLAWSSAYNQVLCGAFLLGALLLFMRHTETGRTRDLVLCWVVFLIGFGVLELNLVFPALALGYAVLFARKAWVRTVPMFVVSGAYAVLHRMVAPKVTGGPYAMHIDPASLVQTLWAYWVRAFGMSEIDSLPVDPWVKTLAVWLPLVLTAGLGSFLIFRLRRRDWGVLFGLVWFVTVLSPVLPLRDHVSLYYLTLPTMGLALVGAQAVMAGCRRGFVSQFLAFLLALGYVGLSGTAARSIVTYHKQRSREVRDLVLGVEEIRAAHPKKTILLTGISSGLYWAGVNDNPFRLLGITDVFLAPGAEEHIEPHPELGDPQEYILPAAQTREALESGAAVVYLVDGDKLRNITRRYSTIAKSSLMWGISRRVMVGSMRFNAQLGEGWHGPEGHFRWMTLRAVVFLKGPEKAGSVLRVEGFCPRLPGGPVTLSATVDGETCGSYVIATAEERFAAEFTLGDDLIGRDKVKITLALDHPVQKAADGRDLGMPISVVAIR